MGKDDVVEYQREKKLSPIPVPSSAPVQGPAVWFAGCPTCPGTEKPCRICKSNGEDHGEER